jgi:hypothetical protein
MNNFTYRRARGPLTPPPPPPPTRKQSRLTLSCCTPLNKLISTNQIYANVFFSYTFIIEFLSQKRRRESRYKFGFHEQEADIELGLYRDNTHYSGCCCSCWRLHPISGQLTHTTLPLPLPDRQKKYISIPPTTDYFLNN